MDVNLPTEKWTLEDGRRAERRVTEVCSNDSSERTIELHVEDERPLRLQQRVIEKSKPIVYERKIETLDPKSGSVLETKVESIEPKVQMQLVEHSACVSAQSIDSPVTKQEMIDTIVSAVRAMRESDSPVLASKNFSEKLQTLGVAEEISNRLESCGLSMTDKILLGVIGVMVCGLGYMVYFM